MAQVVRVIAANEHETRVNRYAETGNQKGNFGPQVRMQIRVHCSGIEIEQLEAGFSDSCAEVNQRWRFLSR